MLRHGAVYQGRLQEPWKVVQPELTGLGNEPTRAGRL